MSGPAELSAVKLALAAQAARAAREPTSEAGLLASEPIAIIGMGCRFPGGAGDPEQLWTLLENGVDAVTRVPATRWDPALEDTDVSAPGKHASPWAGMLDDIAGFDAEFFGIAPREAVRMDPQQRVLLEVTWDALRDAGCRADALRGSPTGVFVAVYSDDYARNLYNEWEHIDAHTASGNSHGVTAGRIAYLLDLRGPALSIDTACSSSLVALHSACTSLRTGETSLAIVGATNLLIGPEQTVSLSKWGMMAKDGRCKTFDASADGWVRGEGAGTLVLKRLADALGDGDRVHAVIRGTAVNQDGHSAVLTAPNGLAQRAVVRAALANALMPASRVTYVEAHGTGTVVGDPIELEALVDEIGHTDGAPCHIGTIKANIGHLEAAAGMAGLIKVVQSMKHERIPPHLHFHSLNPLVSLDGTRLRIARAGVPWPAQGDLRVAGVSSFGLGGTNGHVILEEAPRLPAVEAPDDGPWLATVSAHDATALSEAVGDACDALMRAPARDVAWTLDTFDALRYRVSAVGATAEALAVTLRDSMIAAIPPVTAPRRVAMVFSGHGSQWTGMARESFARGGPFADSLRESDTIVQQLAGWSLLDVLHDDSQAPRLDDTSVFQPVLVALQLAMAAQWAEAGVQPSAVVGHSVGELSAACVAGALTREDALRIAVERGRLMQSMAGAGAMLAVRGDAATIRRLASETPDVVIASENGPGMFTLSGEPEAMAACETCLASASVECRRVHVSRAFHSPAMNGAAAALADRLSAMAPQPTQVPFYSSVTGVRMDGRQLDAQYWARNAREMVQFAAAAEALVADGIGAMIEVSPHPIVLTALLATFEQHAPSITLVPTWRRERGERATWLQAVGTLWNTGVALDTTNTFAAPGTRVTLPGYRWQRQPLWSGSPLPLGRPPVASAGPVGLPGRMTEVPSLQAVVFDGVVRSTDAIVRDHRVFGRVVVPGTMILLAVLDASRRSQPMTAPLRGDGQLALRDVMLDRALVLDDGGARTVQIVVRTGDDDGVTFTVSSRADGNADSGEWVRHAAGAVVMTTPPAPDDSRELLTSRGALAGDVPALYASLSEAGVALGPPFRLVTAFSLGAGEAVAHLTVADHVVPANDVLAADAARLDAALHAIRALIPGDGDEHGIWLPVSYDEVFAPDPSAIAGSHVVLRSDATANLFVADVVLLDAGGTAVGMVRGVRLQRTDRGHLEQLVGAPIRRPVFEVIWEPAAPASAALPGDSRWLVFEDEGATPIADAIELAGGRATRVGKPALRDAADVDAVMQALLTTLLPPGSRAPTGIVFAWGLDAARARSADSVLEGVLSIAGSAMALVRELAARGVTPERGVLFVTRGVAAVPGDIAPGSPGAGGLWGLRHSADVEFPLLGLRALDLPMHIASAHAGWVVDECASTDGAVRVARRGEERLVARLRTAAPSEAAVGPVALALPLRPVLEALTSAPITRRAPGAGMVEIAVEAAGLNFRDVLGALGMVSLPTDAFGGECAGIVSAVGNGVTSVQVGDRVLSLAQGALRTHVEVAADLVAPMPAWLSFEHASTVPVAYMTAWHALVTVARVQRGDRVLVHAASGGVGMAAVHLAHLLGATVIGTAGSPEKRAYLLSIGVQTVFDSRAVTFLDALRNAAGEGTIDVVLNALSGEFIPASLDVLRAGGHFVEIGKRGIWSAADVAARRRDVTYTAFDLSELAPPDAASRGDVLREITALIASAALPVLPTTAFPLSEAVDAFRFMAQARHTGKLTIVMPSQASTLRTDGAYVVTGAFGALGRGVVDTLVASGARHLVLMARRAPTDAESVAWLASLASVGVVAQVSIVDVGDGAAVTAALDHARQTLPPLRGIVHTAGVNDDGSLLTQTARRLHDVARGKVGGASLLDRGTRNDAIDFFVAFSSASAVLGWPGQTTYSAANGALDQVMALRKASGRTAVSLQWGAWAGGGMAARVTNGARQFAAAGMASMAADKALSLCMALRRAPHHALLVIDADWDAFAAARPRDAALYSRVRHPSRAAASSASVAAVSRTSLRAEVLSLPESLRADAVRDAIMKMAVRALGAPPTAMLDGSRALRDLGLDSLMAVELRNTIGAALERTLPATLLFEHPTVDDLAAHVGALLHAERPTAPAPTGTSDVGPPSARGSSSDVVAMSDEDAEALLLAELAARPTPPRSPR